MADQFRVPEINARQVTLDPRALRVAKPMSRLESPSFREVLTQTMSEVQRLQDEADMTIRQLVAGEITDVTEAMVAVERADVAFQTMMAVRNRMIAAYEEVMRMQV